ncbi:MAG: hypothetical protein ACRDMV_05780 [Streptosporangiales bacterium]
MWERLQLRLRQTNIAIDSALMRKDERAFVLLCQERRRIHARLTEITMRGICEPVP